MVRRDTAVVAAAVAATLTGGGMLTKLGPWYFQLEKPSFQPPGWLFGPAWTTIGVLTGLAIRDGWEAADTPARRRRLFAVCGVNAALNILWSDFFFNRRRPDWALAEVGPLWLSIGAMILLLPRRRATPLARARSTWLLLPYLLWVSFATVLNAAIVRLNAPFGAAGR